MHNSGSRWRLLPLLFTLLAFLGAPSALAEETEFNFETGGVFQQEDEFLSVDEAFTLIATVVEGELKLRWEMPDGYYLYRHQFGVDAQTANAFRLQEAVIPAGKQKFDEYFGDVEVYYHSAEISVPVVHDSGSVSPGSVNGTIQVRYQGCADAGLCYPPEAKNFDYDGASLVPVALGGTSAAAVTADVVAVPPSSGAIEIPVTEEQALAGILADESLLYALALFFLAGIGLAFTPCVLPMVPILSSIIVGEGEGISQRRAFTLSLAYVLGMAITYAFIGTLVGLFGATLNLQAALQSPPVLIFFALVFVVLSFAMFGFYELQLPQSWQNRLNQMGSEQKGGKHASVFIMGAVSSLVVSPCVSAPLAGALIYISTSDDAVLGGTALLSLGLGMGCSLAHRRCQRRTLVAQGGCLDEQRQSGLWCDVVGGGDLVIGACSASVSYLSLMGGLAAWQRCLPGRAGFFSAQRLGTICQIGRGYELCLWHIIADWCRDGRA